MNSFLKNLFYTDITRESIFLSKRSQVIRLPRT
ncbi:hypothetical protein ABFA07_020460 [Porites harrisoni]